MQPVDWGPNEKTGRVSDLSPGLMKALGITTDDVVTVRMEAPGPAMPTVPSVGAPWLDVMKEITGTKEVPGSGDNQEILGWASYIAGKFPDMADYCALYKHDETAWCGLTVAYCMARCDIRPIFGATDTDKFLWANAWRQFGVAVDSPMPGDVLTFRWSNGSNHVALYDHETPGDQYAARGGNQSDAVNVTMFPMNACTSIRRPA